MTPIEPVVADVHLPVPPDHAFGVLTAGLDILGGLVAALGAG